jgi:2-keto-3-deoxy-L-rhamnonate aldolase RhmA
MNTLRAASGRTAINRTPPARSKLRHHTRLAATSSSQQDASAQFGLFVVSGSFTAAEALSYSGLDWMCLDCQHGAVGYTELGHMLAATSASGIKRIVRVGGPHDQFGIQQALE